MCYYNIYTARSYGYGAGITGVDKKADAKY
jgi:hypothetical protein